MTPRTKCPRPVPRRFVFRAVPPNLRSPRRSSITRVCRSPRRERRRCHCARRRSRSRFEFSHRWQCRSRLRSRPRCRPLDVRCPRRREGFHHSNPLAWRRHAQARRVRCPPKHRCRVPRRRSRRPVRTSRLRSRAFWRRHKHKLSRCRSRRCRNGRCRRSRRCRSRRCRNRRCRNRRCRSSRRCNGFRRLGNAPSLMHRPRGLSRLRRPRTVPGGSPRR